MTDPADTMTRLDIAGGIVCRFRGHAEARFVMLPEFFGLYRYSRIECRRCGALIEDGYHPTDEEVAAYNVWAASPEDFVSERHRG